MKSLTLTLSIVALLAAGASAFFYLQIGNTKEELQRNLYSETVRADGLKQDVDRATERIGSLEQDRARLDAELGDTKSRLSSEQARGIQVNRDLQTVRTQLSAREEAVQTLNTEVSQLRRELVQARLATAPADTAEVEQFRQTIATLEARVRELQSGASLAGTTPSPTLTTGTATATTTPRIQMSAAQSANVSTVGPMNAFVVISFGSANGAQVGQTFSIKRDNSEIARVRISDARENFSVAQVAPDSLRSALRPGDLASIVMP